MDDSEIVYVTAAEKISIETIDAIADACGNPTTCDSEAAWKLMDAIIDFWEANFPKEVEDWRHDRALDLKLEREKHKLCYNPITYPPRLFKLIKLFFPDQKLTDKKFHSELVKRHALFKTTNYKL